VLKELWARITGRQDEAASKRLAEEQQMSPAERRVIEDGVEARDDEQAQALLGGTDPDRLIEE
jgi:hypothetical protein